MLSPVSLQTNIVAFLAPWPRLCVSQHGTFCLTPGGNTGANYRGQWSPPTPDVRPCSMQTPVTCLTPGPLVFVLAVYTPSTSSPTWARCQEHRCHKHQDMSHIVTPRVRGTGDRLEVSPWSPGQRQWLPGVGNVSSAAK